MKWFNFIHQQRRRKKDWKKIFFYFFPFFGEEQQAGKKKWNRTKPEAAKPMNKKEEIVKINDCFVLSWLWFSSVFCSVLCSYSIEQLDFFVIQIQWREDEKPVKSNGLSGMAMLMTHDVCNLLELFHTFFLLCAILGYWAWWMLSVDLQRLYCEFKLSLWLFSVFYSLSIVGWNFFELFSIFSSITAFLLFSECELKM